MPREDEEPSPTSKMMWEEMIPTSGDELPKIYSISAVCLLGI